MKQIIMNQRNYIENIINTNLVPDDLSIQSLIFYLCNYYYYKGVSSSELKNTVLSQIEAFHLSSERYRAFVWSDEIHRRTKNIVDNNSAYALNEFDYIPLYESEVETIKKCTSRRGKKITAAFIFLARYSKGSTHTSDEFENVLVRNKTSEVSKLANIHATVNQQNDLCFELKNKGIISLDKDNSYEPRHYVTLSPTTEKVVYTFTSPKNIGNQIVAFLEPKYMVCEKCGRLVKKPNGSSANNIKYCKKCYEEIHKEQMKDVNKKRREEAKRNFLRG